MTNTVILIEVRWPHDPEPDHYLCWGSTGEELFWAVDVIADPGVCQWRYVRSWGAMTFHGIKKWDPEVEDDSEVTVDDHVDALAPSNSNGWRPWPAAWRPSLGAKK